MDASDAFYAASAKMRLRVIAVEQRISVKRKP
jgi:hypothetical protein